MAFVIEPSHVVGAIGLTRATIERNEQIRRVILRVYNRVRLGKICVPTFGAGGTGKSTLGTLFAARFLPDWTADALPRSIELEHYEFSGNLEATLIAAPGQTRYLGKESVSESARWDTLYQLMAQGKSPLVINVVCYGLHSFRGGTFRDSAYYQPGMTLEEFVAHYMIKRREAELHNLDALLEPLKIAPGTVRFLTVVAKQDLWWNERGVVEKYYTDEASDYMQRIRAVKNYRGNEQFPTEFVSACLYRENLRTDDGTMLVPVSAGYDDITRRMNLNNLASIMETMMLQPRKK
jgi:hypothetical protein